MSPQVDFSSVSDGFEPLPDGKYAAVLAEYEFRTAQGSGNPYVALTFNLVDHEGRKAWRNFSLQPQALWALKAALVAMGIDRDSLGGTVDVEEVLQSAISNSCTLTLAIREYNGKLSNEVKAVTA
jgi:hypothetical protein